MQGNLITGSLSELPRPGYVRLRCALCGRNDFGDGSMQLRFPGMAVDGAPGMLCEDCVTAVDRMPLLRPGIEAAVRAGACLVDVFREGVPQ